MRDFPAPIFSIDIERETGVPQPMIELHRRIQAADGVILAAPEHNGSMTAILKNTIDWLSRVECGQKFLARWRFGLSLTPEARLCPDPEWQRYAPGIMETHSLFDTPLSVFRPEGLGELNATLTRRILAESTETTGILRSNRGGWHSQPDLALREDDCFKQLIQTMLRSVGRAYRQIATARGLRPPRPTFSIQAWATVMRSGDYVTLHDHAEAHFSVIYYPDIGGPSGPASGLLTVVNARRGRR